MPDPFFFEQVYDRVDLDAAPGPETTKVDLSPNTLLALRSLGCSLTGVQPRLLHSKPCLFSAILILS